MTSPSAVPNPDPVELADLYAAGAVSDEEHTHFEARLMAGDAPYVAAYEQVRGVAEHLLHSAPPVPPPTGARNDILRRIAHRTADPGFLALSSPKDDPIGEDPLRQVIMRGDEIDWQDTGVPGVRSRNLFVDREHRRMTVLIQMDPGAVFPDHEHPGVEECMVIDGDLHIAGTVLRKFDYLRTPKGEIHGTPRTENGCLLLVTCPLGDAA